MPVRRRRHRSAPTLLVVALILSPACRVPDMDPESHYPTFAAAVADGAVARGWVPDTLPADATDIWEMHDIDSEEVWIRFTSGSEALGAMARACAEVDALEVAWPRGTRQLSWWPHDLPQAVSSQASPWRFFRCPAPDRYPGQRYTLPTFLALAEGERRAWYWRRP